MTEYVYLLSDYNEYGSEHVHATLDRSALIAIMKKHWPGWKTELLEELLKRPDSELDDEGGSINLDQGWGGVQLHVVKLEPYGSLTHPRQY